MKFGYALAAVVALGACSGNPLGDTTSGSGSSSSGSSSSGSSSSGGISGSTTLPPGTTSPTASSNIVRYEATDGTTGSGYATNVVYDAGTDTFTVQNLPFSGAKTFNRGTAVSQLGVTTNGVSPFAVYEGPTTAADAITGTSISQFGYRAIYAVSPSGKTQVGIVRTGDFINYGFGGYVYQRNGGVTLPASGQANYSGNYAGLIDFDGQGGLEYTTGTMAMAIDFTAFNTSQTGTGVNAVSGTVSNRQIYDINGNVVTPSVLAALSTQQQVTITALPTLVFTVQPSVMTANGEIAGDVTSSLPGKNGPTAYETGTYYAVLAGTNASEVAGIIVVTSAAPGATGVTQRETGGFIAQRQ
ncbi:MAG: hypothetical protein GC186_09885 [Rhodobacteraceae bacterium]|nr:hypothetical protein [Paracoccaceae bacterium]